MRSLFVFLSVVFMSSFAFSKEQCKKSFFQKAKESVVYVKKHPKSVAFGVLGGAGVAYGIATGDPLIIALGGFGIASSHALRLKDIFSSITFDSITREIFNKEFYSDKELDIETVQRLFREIIFVDGDFSREITLLVGKGLKVNEPVDISGLFQETPLHLAARHDNAITIETLIGLGAKTSVENHQGKTPMDLAVERGNKSAIQALKQ